MQFTLSFKLCSGADRTVANEALVESGPSESLQTGHFSMVTVNILVLTIPFGVHII